MDVFDKVIPSIVNGLEGGSTYTNDPTDRGGGTKYGVTENLARAAGYQGAMQNLTYDQAVAVLRLFFWKQPGFDQVAELSPTIAEWCLQAGMNLGESWPSKFLQRALNVMTDGKPLLVDGKLGALTFYTLKVYLASRKTQGETVLLHMMQAQASVRYMELAEQDVSQEKYEFGWQCNRAFAISKLTEA